MNKIAIITADKQLSRLCELECKLNGYAVETFTSAQSLRKSFARYLWDIDTVPEISKMQENNSILMSRKEDFFENEQRLRIPPSLERLRYLINNYSTNEFPLEQKTANALVLIDRKTRTISYGDKYTDLSEHEFKVLTHLCANHSKPVKREELNSILGAESGNISDVYIYHLRKKLEILCGSRMISTVRNQGYMIEIALEEQKNGAD